MLCPTASSSELREAPELHSASVVGMTMTVVMPSMSSSRPTTSLPSSTPVTAPEWRAPSPRRHEASSDAVAASNNQVRAARAVRVRRSNWVGSERYRVCRGRGTNVINPCFSPEMRHLDEPSPMNASGRVVNCDRAEANTTSAASINLDRKTTCGVKSIKLTAGREPHRPQDCGGNPDLQIGRSESSGRRSRRRNGSRRTLR